MSQAHIPAEQAEDHRNHHKPENACVWTPSARIKLSHDITVVDDVWKASNKTAFQAALTQHSAAWEHSRTCRHMHQHCKLARAKAACRIRAQQLGPRRPHLVTPRHIAGLQPFKTRGKASYCTNRTAPVLISPSQTVRRTFKLAAAGSTPRLR